MKRNSPRIIKTDALALKVARACDYVAQEICRNEESFSVAAFCMQKTNQFVNDHLLDDAIKPLGCSVYTVHMLASAEPVLDFVQESHGHQQLVKTGYCPIHLKVSGHMVYTIFQSTQSALGRAPMPPLPGGWRGGQ